MENKTGKYFKYAIGEIVLVVIGILIALQINNWNENRKDILEENKILQNLNTEFKSNLIKVDSSIIGIKKTRKNIDSVLKIMNKTISIDDNPITLDRLLYKTITNPTYFPSSMIIKELESSGKLPKLKNKKLKELLYRWNSKFDQINVAIEISSNSYKDYIDYIKVNGSLRRLDFVADQQVLQTILKKSNSHLLSDLKFENVVDDHYVLLGFRKTLYEEAVQIIKSIIEQTESSKL